MSSLVVRGKSFTNQSRCDTSGIIMELFDICSPGPLAEQASQDLQQKSPKLFATKGRKNRSATDAADYRFACQLLEVLSEFQLLPFAPNETLQPTLVAAPVLDAADADTAPTHTHASFGAHLGSGFPAAAAVLSAHVQATRHRLLWEMRDMGVVEGVNFLEYFVMENSKAVLM
jgi:hypothetical protein